MSDTPVTSTEGSAELRQRLDILIALTLCQMGDKFELREVMNALARVKVPPREIAVLLGVTANAVSIALHRSRKAGKTKKKPVPRKS